MGSTGASLVSIKNFTVKIILGYFCLFYILCEAQQQEGYRQGIALISLCYLYKWSLYQIPLPLHNLTPLNPSSVGPSVRLSISPPDLRSLSAKFTFSGLMALSVAAEGYSPPQQLERNHPYTCVPASAL